MTDDDKLFWLKAVFALIAALVCSTSPTPIGKIGLGIALLIYLATYPVAVFVLKVPQPKGAGTWKVIQKMILSGLITYLFIFLVTSGILFTLINY
ncbi:MAG: hypothetical protein WED04_03625 [Promethearchaeati archaeon SRVP18_Atabeyarchaeia-1]